MKLLSAPLHVFWNVTEQCNLACTHCSADSRRHAVGDLDTVSMLRIADQLADVRVFNVTVTGGEPFVREDIFTILQRLRERRVSICWLNTNATLVGRAEARRLAELGIHDACIGMEGPNTDISEQIRGKGSFDRQISGIHNLIAAGLHVSIGLTVTRCNYSYDTLEQVVKLGKGLGVKSVALNSLHFAGRARINQKRLVLTKAEHLQVCESARRLADEHPGFVTGTYLSKVDLPKRKPVAGDRLPSLAAPCSVGVSSCTINPNGNIVPCGNMDDDAVCGNLTSQTLLEIWQHSPVFLEIRSVRQMTVDCVPECAACQFKERCYGGCRASAYAHSGSWRGFDASCWYASD